MQQTVLTPKESNKFHFFTSIWMVPLGALLISLWLVYQYYSGLGTEINIYFKKSAGLKAGHSKVKYKDITVGTLKDIVLDGERDGVLAVVSMNKEVEALVNKNTQFWIVKPEIGFSGISGLDTLFSGSYISMYSEGKGKFVSNFVGLESAPYNKEDVNFFHLSATPDQHVSQGMPIYYNSVVIGKVRRVAVSADGTAVDVSIHIESNYLPYIHRKSQFWLKSLIDVGLSNVGLSVKVAPLSHLASGGIVLSTLGKGDNMSVPSDFIFTLHDSEYASKNQHNTLGRGGDFVKVFQINTTQNVAKLSVGSNVSYQSYQAGEVLDVAPSYDALTHQVKTRILLSIDTSIFATDAQDIAQSIQAFYQAISQGLHANIDSNNPITGALFIDLIFGDKDVKQQIMLADPYPILPTTGQASVGILDGISKVVDKVSKLPLEELVVAISELIDDNATPVKSIVADLSKTMAQIKKFTDQPSFATLPNQLASTMEELSQTLNATKTLLKRDQQSVLAEQVTQTLKSVTEAAQQLEKFLSLLNRQPNALIFGEDE